MRSGGDGAMNDDDGMTSDDVRRKMMSDGVRRTRSGGARKNPNDGDARKNPNDGGALMISASGLLPHLP
jgi:hypothetical protein